MNDLRQAAQAVIDRWDSPLWKNGSTADAIADLRAALEQEAEPVACKTLCELCVKRGYDFCANVAKTTPIIISPTPPQQQAEPCQFCGLVQCDPRCMWIQKDIGVEQVEPVAWIVDGGKKNGELLHTHEYALELVAPKIMCKPLYTAPPQQQAEPVSNQTGETNGRHDERTSEANIGIAGFGAKVEPARQNPYGAVPPLRKPLTDEEIADIYMKHTDKPKLAQWGYARAIEAKLKEGHD